jgi:hypothetical protein
MPKKSRMTTRRFLTTAPMAADLRTLILGTIALAFIAHQVAG